MDWHLVYTKSKQESVALENLQRQGYECYLPLLRVEKVSLGVTVIKEEPLFPRYLFVRMGIGFSAKSWGPIRSTKGVNHLVILGGGPAAVDDLLIKSLRRREASLKTKPLFECGERVILTQSPFKGIEGIYQITDGDRRAMVLIEMLSKSVTVLIEPASLRKTR